MHITWLGHSAFRVEIKQATILIDPYLTSNPSFTGNFEEVTQGVTHIIITHGHFDHVGDTVEIAKKTGAQVISNYEIGTYLAAQGVEKTNPGGTGGTIFGRSFSTSFVHAQHSSSADENGKSIYMGLATGVVLKSEGEKTLYHMGDTDVFGDMSLINELHQPHIGIVPIGDRFTMGPKTAALAVRRYFNFETVLPCHFGTFDALTGTVEAFKEALGTSDYLVQAHPVNKKITY
jgi:L-ascorbate metabolism protein UlaG (beta-lactamase superfamily)